MSKLFKGLVLASIIGLFFVGAVMADMLDEVQIPVGGTIAGAFYLDVQTRLVSDNSTVAPSTIAFSGAGTATELNPWVISDQYLNVNFAGNYGEWGIHLLTKNQDDIGGLAAKPLTKGPDAQWGVAGVDDDGNEVVDDDAEAGWPGTDDFVSYGGLIDEPTKDNPDNRALFAWRVQNGFLGNGVTPAILDDDEDAVAEPNEVCASGAVNYQSDWKFIVDSANTGYDVSYVRFLDDNGTPANPDDDFDVYNYAMSVFGFATGDAIMSLNTAGTMPQAAHSDDDIVGYKDVAVYLGARFHGLMPGTYGSQLYVQFINE